MRAVAESLAYCLLCPWPQPGMLGGVVTWVLGICFGGFWLLACVGFKDGGEGTAGGSIRRDYF